VGRLVRDRARAGAVLPRAARQRRVGRDYAFGSALVVVAAIVWALYALLQKQLLTRLGSPAIQAFIYSAGRARAAAAGAPRELLR
jgi:drug/metabolite transporter (DMT)-like permease